MAILENLVRIKDNPMVYFKTDFGPRTSRPVSLENGPARAAPHLYDFLDYFAFCAFLGSYRELPDISQRCDNLA